jgi:hypothetical protein
MPYQVDVWAGDLHQNLVGSARFDEWVDAADFMRKSMDEGSLCNVLHTDFIAPPERARETEIELAKYLTR